MWSWHQGLGKLCCFFSQNPVHGYVVHHSVVAVFSFVTYSSDPCNTVHIIYYIGISRLKMNSCALRNTVRCHYVSTIFSVISFLGMLYHCPPRMLQSLWGHHAISGELSPSKSTDWLTNYGMSPWWPLLGLPSWCPIFKSSQCNSFLIWRSVTRRLNLRVPDHQMSCSDLTTWHGTRMVALAMAGWCHILLFMIYFIQTNNKMDSHGIILTKWVYQIRTT